VEVNGERRKAFGILCLGGKSICVSKADNVVMRQVDGQRQLGRRTRDRKRF
jgi:hypothetical protein